MARNKFKAALNHIKSTDVDEKIQRLNEAPTNSMSGVYDLSPRGQRYGEKNPPKTFYANLDGSWPPGVPGTPGERTYVRPVGYWEEGPGAIPSVQHDEVVELDFSYDTQTDDPRNTKTLIDETTGRVKTDLPPNSRSFILGPLVDMFWYNHGYDSRTFVGYIQKDTREFVLLGSIPRTWGDDNNGVPIRADGYEGRTGVWDGTDSNFISYNPNFTFEMLQWHHERLKEGKYVKNVSFFNSGGQPIIQGAGGTGQPAGTNQGNVSGTPGPGDAGNNGDADQTHGSGGNPDIGTEQNPPITGDAEDNNIFGDMFKALQKFGQSVLDALNPGSLAQLGARMLRSLTDAANFAGDYIFKGIAEGVEYLPDFTGASNLKIPGLGKVPKIADIPGWVARGFDKVGDNAVSQFLDNTIQGVLGGNYATQYFTPDVGTAVKYAGEGGTVVAIPRTQGVAGIKNWFGSNVSRGFDPSKGVEQLVRTADTVAADAAGATQKFALNNADDVARMTQLASQGSKANTVLGKLGRAVPFVGAAAATADVSIRTAQGDYTGALLGGISAIPGPVGWVGLGAQIISDATGTSNPNSPSNQMLKGLFGGQSTSGRGAGRRAFREEYLTEEDEMSFLSDLRGAMFELGVPMDKTEYAKQQCALLLSMGINPGLVMLIAKAIQQEPFTPNEEKYLKKNLPIMISMFANIREQINLQATNKNTVKESRQVLAESRQRILREIKQPVPEVSELKPQKLKKYRPNFKGRFTAQNTPDVTACKESDNMVKAKNAAGQTWRTSDKYWGGYESQERINVIYDHVGHGQIYWDEVVAHNQSKKGVRNRDVQEELNKHYATLAEKKIMKELSLNEQETLEAPNDPLLKRVMGKLKSQIDYPDKPSPMGYPDGPTPQQVAGYHPEYGKRANYYDRLDQKSADAMPATGDPEIDAKVNAQKTPLKKKSKKEIKEEARLIQSNWREETQLQESDWTPVAGSIANSSSQTFEYPGGSRVTVSGLGGVETTPSTVTINQFGDIFDVPAPNFSQLGLQGYAKPLGRVNRRRDFENVNPRLDASQEFARNVNSDVFMNARVQSGEFTPKQQAAIDAWNAELRATMDRHGREWEAVLKKDGGYNPEKHKGLQARQDAEIEAVWDKEPKFDVPPDPSVPLDYDPFKGVDAPDPSVPLDYNPPEPTKVDPYADRILELNMALDKMKEKGTLISHYKLIGPGEEGYVDTTNMANAIGYNRKPIYTAPAQEMFAELERLYELQLAWLEKQNPGGEVQGADDALDDYNSSMGPNSEPPSDAPEDPNEPVPTPDDDLLDQLAKMFGVGSAKNFLDHYADNFVKGDGKQDQNLTNLLSKNDRNWLKNALAGDSAITNPKRFDNPQDAFSMLMQRAPRGIRNSIGNGAKLDMDHYRRTGDFKIDKSYVFTEPRDFGARSGSDALSNIATLGTAGYARSKAGGNPFANASSFINNPMRFHVIIPGPKKKIVDESTWSKLKKHR